MAEKTGNVDFTNSSFTIRVNWKEMYNEESNESSVSVTSVRLKSTEYAGVLYYPTGTISVNGVEVANFQSLLGTHYVELSSKNTFYNVIANDDSKNPPWTIKGIKHEENGKKTIPVSINVTLWRTESGSGSGTNISGVKNIELTSGKRISTLSVENGTLGVEQTLTVTRPATGLRHTIVAFCGSENVVVCTKVADASIKFTPPIEWASRNKSGTTVPVKYRITTFDGSTELGSNEYTVRCAIPSTVKPICILNVTDEMGYESRFGAFIQGRSKFRVQVSAELAYGSEIVRYETTIKDNIFNSADFVTDIITISGNIEISGMVTDKRGRKGGTTVTKKVLEYNRPQISLLKVNRCDADGTVNEQGEYVKVTFSAKVSALADKNVAVYSVGYKRTSDYEYNTEIIRQYTNNLNVENGTYIFQADSGYSYDVMLVVSDHFAVSSKRTVVSTAFTLMHWSASGRGLGIGKLSEEDGLLDIGLLVRFYAGILQPVLSDRANLDDIVIPNTYCGKDPVMSQYSNCPVTDFPFSLEVLAAGDNDQIMQRLNVFDTVNPETYVRIYNGFWGEWVNVTK